MDIRFGQKALSGGYRKFSGGVNQFLTTTAHSLSADLARSAGA
jgi:hypothetical protein